MTQVVKIPDPVYEELSKQAEKQDIARGGVVHEWMEKAEAFDSELFQSRIIDNGDE
jgi:hypothetical protein